MIRNPRTKQIVAEGKGGGGLRGMEIRREQTVNEVIMGLYEIEEQAGKIMEESSLRRQEISEEYQRQKEQAEAELKAEYEGRLTILRSQIEEQKSEEIARLTEESQEQIRAINASYEQSLGQFAREIVGRITEG